MTDIATGQPARTDESSRLSRGVVVDAALRIADEQGLDALTVRRLAEVLGVTPAALYRYVADKAELLDLIFAAVFEETDLTLPYGSADPVERIVAVMDEQRRVLLRHPGVHELFASRSILNPAALRVSNAVLSELLRAGLRPQAAMRTYTALLSYLLGTTLIDRGRARYKPDHGAAEAVRQWLRNLPADEYPSVVRTADHWIERAPDEAFRSGLRRLLSAYLS